MITNRFATAADTDVLGELNHQLIQDEGHRNPMSPAELAERMLGWIGSDYNAVIFQDAENAIVAYALYREAPDSIYLRQFFVQRHRRRSGLGRICMHQLLKEIWPKSKRITVDVLCSNAIALSFWRSVGFSDYCLTLERNP